MKLGFLSLTILGSLVSFLSAVQVGDFVVISGLVSKPEYNGSIALVQKVNETAERHRVLRADNDCIRSYTLGMNFDDCMRSVLIKEANMIPVAWNAPEKLSVAQMVSNYATTGQLSQSTDHEISADERSILDELVFIFRIAETHQRAGVFKMPDFVESMLYNLKPYVDRSIPAEECAFLDRLVSVVREMCQDSPAQLRKPKNVEKLRLLGAWINQNHGFHAMVYVNEAYEPLKDVIEYLWDQIGVWTKEKYITMHF